MERKESSLSQRAKECALECLPLLGFSRETYMAGRKKISNFTFKKVFACPTGANLEETMVAGYKEISNQAKELGAGIVIEFYDNYFLTYGFSPVPLGFEGHLTGTAVIAKK